MMKTIQLRSRADKNGMLKIEVPVGNANQDVEVAIVVAPVRLGTVQTEENASAWPPGFFTETFGCLKSNPLERAPQGAFEAREPLN